ncbi:MAG: ammonia-forming cytochrome c nitrite reductase subunit c552 [Deltaproteobacteria bacterium]|nr:ammonia-forming cytochrome c nitrite reductase subunit c552 [Deltaproteobacteria bacterium]
MARKIWMVVFSAFIVAALAFSAAQAEKEKKPAKKSKSKAVAVKSVNEAICFGCHQEVQALKEKGKHAKGVNCALCHSETAGHLADSAKKPITRLDAEACGACHKEQWQTLMEVTLKSKAKLEKATTISRSPTFDKLMMPHGFTKEHDEPRSHAFMLIDHMIVDRGYGGRFQLRDWTYINKTGKLWEIIEDTGKELPQTAKAANTVCFTCKTSDIVLKWPYMGDAHSASPLKRALNPAAVELAKNHLQNPMGCIQCHDPHAAKPRVIRDALIEAVVDRGEGTYPYDQKKSKEITMEKITFKRGGKEFRAIGILNKPDSNLLCAQCHVEYNCNPGFNPETGAPVGMDNRLSNYYPWVNVFDLKKRYASVNFKDFKHAITGAALTKIQHPEVETYWGSKHEKAGVECKDCHMPRVKKKGKEFTFHGQRSARYMLKDTCLRCHPDWTAEQADHQVEAIQNYTRGKMRKAEFWLGELINAFIRAKDIGVGEDVLQEARKEHDRAHILWEWWTAENSDGFHNPGQARQSLAESINASQKGIELLNKAISQKVAQK